MKELCYYQRRIKALLLHNHSSISPCFHCIDAVPVFNNIGFWHTDSHKILLHYGGFFVSGSALPSAHDDLGNDFLPIEARRPLQPTLEAVRRIPVAFDFRSQNDRDIAGTDIIDQSMETDRGHARGKYQS